MAAHVCTHARTRARARTHARTHVWTHRCLKPNTMPDSENMHTSSRVDEYRGTHTHAGTQTLSQCHIRQQEQQTYQGSYRSTIDKTTVIPTTAQSQLIYQLLRTCHSSPLLAISNFVETHLVVNDVRLAAAESTARCKRVLQRRSQQVNLVNLTPTVKLSTHHSTHQQSSSVHTTTTPHHFPDCVKNTFSNTTTF